MQLYVGVGVVVGRSQQLQAAHLQFSTLSLTEPALAKCCLRTELEATDRRLQGWALRPDDLSICRHEDGSEVSLGSGSYSSVRNLACWHASQDA